MKFLTRHPWLFWVWFILSALIYCWVLLGPYGHAFENLLVRIGILAVPAAISVFLLKVIWDKRSFWFVLLVTLIGYCFIYIIIGFIPNISTYPFTLTWSEGTAYYFASLFLSENIYGIKVNLPTINPTRHLLMAIPFLVSDLPIWVHRLWEVILWLVISGLAIYLLVRRFAIGDKVVRWAYFAWVFLFLFQGPVYYFLIISLIPILWGFDSKRFKRTLVLVIIGSIWAGASRVNWIIVPGLLAATLYILEEKINYRTWSRYLLFPGIWVAAGTITALLSWYAYTLWSGSPLGDFGTPFVSNLLWYRLFPNATIKGGVLLTVVLVSVPLLGVIAVRLYQSGFNYHPIRRVIIAAILLILFSGGLIVSTKIGGGNNIHNLDAYLFILLVTGSYIYFDKIPPDFHHPEKVSPKRITNSFISLAVLIPVLFALHSGRQVTLPNPVKTENALLTVKEFAVETASEGGKVLFIGERQLLTFGEVEGVPLIHDYERMNLMEMVMAGRETYLNEFYRRIANQEFALIISEPLTLKYKGRNVRFGDENDVYVRSVSEPVLCYYEPIKTISKFPIQLLKPRLEPENCQ